MSLVAVPLLFRLAFVLVVVRFQRDRTEAEWWATHTKDVIAHAREANLTVAVCPATGRAEGLASSG